MKWSPVKTVMLLFYSRNLIFRLAILKTSWLCAYFLEEIHITKISVCIYIWNKQHFKWCYRNNFPSKNIDHYIYWEFAHAWWSWNFCWLDKWSLLTTQVVHCTFFSENLEGFFCLLPLVTQPSICDIFKWIFCFDSQPITVGYQIGKKQMSEAGLNLTS